jgi:hypothetical protein
MVMCSSTLTNAMVVGPTESAMVPASVLAVGVFGFLRVRSFGSP